MNGFESMGMPVQGATESKEVQPVSFMVAHEGLKTSLSEVLPVEEFESRANEDFEPNMQWSKITVANEADKTKWVELYNEQLRLSWEPNQSPEAQVKNHSRLEEIKSELEQLEINA